MLVLKMATILFLAYFPEIIAVKSISWLYILAKGLLDGYYYYFIIQQYRSYNKDLVK